MASIQIGGPRLSAESGAKFAPWQESAYKQALQHALGALPGAGTQANQMFGDVLGEVGGPPAQFTDIPQSAYLTPDVLSQMVNSLFGQAAGRTAAQQEEIREGTAPGVGTGFGIAEQLAGAQRFNDALAQREATRLRGEYAPTINRQAAQAQTNVEAQRAGDDRNRRLLALTRMRDLMTRENALLGQIANFGQPLPFSRTYQNLTGSGRRTVYAQPRRGIRYYA